MLCVSIYLGLCVSRVCDVVMVLFWVRFGILVNCFSLNVLGVISYVCGSRCLVNMVFRLGFIYGLVWVLLIIGFR